MIIPSQNKKSEYTKEKLSDALFYLLEKESFSDITILQITQYANVSRAAFYRNFETKEDIIDYSVQKKITEFMGRIEHDPEKILFDELAFINLWAMEKDYFKLLSKNGLTSIFITHYQRFFVQYLCKMTGSQDIYYDYFASQLAHGTISLLEVWIQHDCKENIEELLEIIHRLKNSMLEQKV